MSLTTVKLDPILGTSDLKFDLKNMEQEVVVLVFYPRDATPGCTLELHEFSNLKKAFAKKGVQVLGLSRDSLKSHQKFKEKQNYQIDLLSDESESVCELFGVMKDKNMYGKKVRGIERSTFVLNRQGKILQEWRKVKPEGHAQEVLDWVTKNL